MSYDVSNRARDQFPVADESTWLVGGVVNPVPQTVVRSVQLELDDWFKMGAHHVPDPAGQERQRDEALAVVAEAIGSPPCSIALARGVSEGYKHVLRGIDFKAGDHIILSDDEEAALLLPTLQLGQELGVHVDIVQPRKGLTYATEGIADRITGIPGQPTSRACKSKHRWTPTPPLPWSRSPWRGSGRRRCVTCYSSASTSG